MLHENEELSAIAGSIASEYYKLGIQSMGNEKLDDNTYILCWQISLDPDLDLDINLVTYLYVATAHDPDTICHFTMLCEVGKVYQQLYKQWLSDRNYSTSESYEIDQEPWIFDRLTKN